MSLTLDTCSDQGVDTCSDQDRDPIKKLGLRLAFCLFSLVGQAIYIKGPLIISFLFYFFVNKSSNLYLLIR